MNIIELSSFYEKNKIDKPSYIKKMYAFHQILFDYSAYLGQTDIKSIEISSDHVLMTDKKFDIRMICPPNDLRVLPIETLNFKNYEEDELEFIFKLLGGNAVVFDIGANLGWYSFAISKTIPSAQIYAFEPLPHIFDYLTVHMTLNNTKNIQAFNFGLSDEMGQSTFFVTPNNSVNASMINVSNSESAQKISVSLTTLDIFTEEHKVPMVDFIKCDVEGAELKVFKGASRILKNNKPAILCEMVRKWTAPFGYHPNDIIDYLKTYGYSCFYINKKGLHQMASMDDTISETNFFFLTKSHIKKLGV
jgi:FkbM family methyltransferase